MPRPRRSPRHRVDSLVRIALLAGRWVERLLAAHEPPLTPAQYLALEAAAEGELMGSELARKLDVSAAAVSQLLSGLEGAGLLERAPRQGDRRRRPLALTAEGRLALGSARGLMRSRLGPLLPHEEHALEDLAARLAGEPPPRRGPPRPR
jgi:DNA-binding MarR family transcriptional regulator